MCSKNRSRVVAAGLCMKQPGRICEAGFGCLSCTVWSGDVVSCSPSQRKVDAGELLHSEGSGSFDAIVWIASCGGSPGFHEVQIRALIGKGGETVQETPGAAGGRGGAWLG